MEGGREAGIIIIHNIIKHSFDMYSQSHKRTLTTEAIKYSTCTIIYIRLKFVTFTNYFPGIMSHMLSVISLSPLFISLSVSLPPSFPSSCQVHPIMLVGFGKQTGWLLMATMATIISSHSSSCLFFILEQRVFKYSYSWSLHNIIMLTKTNGSVLIIARINLLQQLFFPIVIV